ncbi:sce7725 family protein [Facklamia sp. P12932]|uniref:sce7725 family protein n=1 Tax=Facklamia sp. P12932 TaxID=3421947 RepID=UPI003D16CBA2
MNKILLADNFNKQKRNADYVGDKYFSSDHLSFKKDGYIGFLDYYVMGKDFMENGFSPHAVAIHIIDCDKKRT